ncbi:TPA: hypothetical protein N0J77_000266 [Pseudomonas aeruginosa]|uniref:hypothetical protein n=1 Tax=Pseudomonas aeruginosa TaxID=287 RepID=UPI000F541582|nr:hypothetical protein [Pseudomonas aeruginosa]MCD2755938.1 hypothetical protein [Pseudomonas aeruginosa]RUB42429.1 hypothetical protein IPC1429_07525 [Pseudomonas aeruginosa]WOJ13697.1 hypothetical protein M0M55_05995 [Pseudomonas aeruginosa]HCK4322569.1 hypothetical protein [Pseudomonas aeruginosa]HCK5620817.1 hypothetical protein [Pseudomonas aeruginosa]
MKEKSVKDQCHDESMAQKFCSDPNYLASLVEAVLFDGAEGEVDILRRQVEIALGECDTKGGESEPVKKKLIQSSFLLWKR